MEFKLLNALFIKVMKTTVIRLFIVFLFGLFLSNVVSAQPPDPGGNPVYDEPALGGSAPLDGGLGTLLILGLAWATWKKNRSEGKSKSID